MLKFLFGRDSRWVRALELTGLLLAVIFLRRQWGHPTTAGWAFLLLFGMYASVRLCHHVAWYPAAYRGRGIEVHFKKALVPTSYLLLATGAAILALPRPATQLAVIGIAILLMIVIVGVNGILVYFHGHDRDPLPVNHFSANDYLNKGNAPPWPTLSSSPGKVRLSPSPSIARNG